MLSLDMGCFLVVVIFNDGPSNFTCLSIGNKGKRVWLSYVSFVGHTLLFKLLVWLRPKWRGLISLSV